MIATLYLYVSDILLDNNLSDAGRIFSTVGLVESWWLAMDYSVSSGQTYLSSMLMIYTWSWLVFVAWKPEHASYL